MEDTTKNYQHFLAELINLGEIFCDPMSTLRMDLYWESLHKRCSLEEWQSACDAAIDHETFHKVPLPATLFASIEEARQARKDAAWEEEKRRAIPSPDQIEARRIKDRQSAMEQMDRDEQRKGIRPYIEGNRQWPRDSVRTPTLTMASILPRFLAQPVSIQTPMCAARTNWP